MRDGIIVTDNLTKVYGKGIRAVDGVSFSVFPGEIFGLLGPNGAGKSTTMGMLTTLLRPTGGRAVLHDREVTYSVVVSTALFPGSVVETYRRLSAGLVEGLRLLGLPAEVQDGPPRAGLRSAACFDSPSWYELVVGGRKVVGSAQVRRLGVLLQHGSIPLEFSASDLVSLLRVPEGWRARLREDLAAHAAGLCDLGRPVSFAQVIDAMVEGFRRALGLELEEGGLSDAERQEARRLREEKYGTWEWNVLGKLKGEEEVRV